MDYEFKKNTLEGNYYCHCSMGHEIVGRWVQEELGTNAQAIAEVFDLLDQAKQNAVQEYKRIGREISLIVCGGEVVIEENVLSHDSELDADSEFDLYQSESTASCGMEDFVDLLEQWQAFVKRF